MRLPAAAVTARSAFGNLRARGGLRLLRRHPNGAGAVFENFLSVGSPVGTHSTDGWPTFAGWPRDESQTQEGTNLSAPKSVPSPAMAGERETVVREFFTHLDAGRLDDSLALLREDIVIVVPPSMSAEPDTYEGLEGAQRYMDGFQGSVDQVRFVPGEIVEEHGRVLVEMTLAGRGARSGIEIRQASAGAIWVEGDRITRIETYPDMDTARSESRGR
jgi:ketosteroid isomerase-like protein